MTRRIAVACSGGRDSTALLHATARAARGSGLEVHALHVNHGLMPEADDWQRALRARCARWTRQGLPLHFHVQRLIDGPPRGSSIEAWARQQRYAALAAMAHGLGIDVVLLAHHRRDQAETLLLQALRGGGAHGLAAMPKTIEREGLHWLRPWLDRPREAIEAYVRRHRLRFADDASNFDRRFARARLRCEVWPALVHAFPDAEGTLAACSRRLAEAAACLDELATGDLALALGTKWRLDVERWLALSPPRRANVLRQWLRTRLRSAVPESLVSRLCEELPRARGGARWPAPARGWIGLHGRLLDWVEPVEIEAVTPRLIVDLSRAGWLDVPQWGGGFEITVGRGLPAGLLAQAELRPRTGGEQFQRRPGSPARALKKQYQDAGLAAWERAAPLVYVRDQLVFVPGLGIDASAPVVGGRTGRVLRWRRNA